MHPHRKGFNPRERSFWVLEGILMYLPPDAPEQLVSAMSSMMSEGSAATGDVFVNMIGSPMVRLRLH